MSKTIVILGMHRSGTSITSKMLTKLGVDMGEKLYGKTFSNPTGHYEDIDFLELNENILISAGGDHLNPPDYDSIIKQKVKYTEPIKAIINARNDKSLWGWKDPRTCLVFDLYLPFLNNPYIIHCKRSENEIAESLNKRQNIPIEYGLKLAQRYESEISKILSKNPSLRSLEINHDNLIKDTAKELDRITDFLDIDVSLKRKDTAIKCVTPKRRINRMVKRRRYYENIRDRFQHLYSKFKFHIKRLIKS